MISRLSVPTRSILAWILLFAGLAASLWASLHVRDDIEQEARQKLVFASEQLTLKIQERLQAYELILRGGAGLFAVKGAVSREEWRRFVQKVEAESLVPGVEGIGYAIRVAPEQLAKHQAVIRAEGFGDYMLRPSGERDVYTAIIYLEPFRDRNLRAFGYDMFSEPVRRAAMVQAMETGRATLSGKVTLVQEGETRVQAGTLMYLPVYRPGALLDSVEQRRAALVGWVYSPFRMDDLMSGILSGWESQKGGMVDLQIHDEGTVDSLMFDGNPAGHLAASAMEVRQTVDVNGRRWRLEFRQPGALSATAFLPVWFVLLSGLGLSALLFALLRSLIHTRQSADQIARRLTAELRQQEHWLAESEERSKFAIDGSGLGVWDWQIADDRVFFSHQWKVLLGYADDEIGNTPAEWLHAATPTIWTACWPRCGMP